MMRFELIGLDADDTLWHSEDLFQEIEDRFADLVTPYLVDPATDPLAALVEVERRNMDLFGYGAKAFTLSMVEGAIELSNGTVPAPVLGAIIDEGRRLLARPVELLDGVEEVVATLSRDHELVVITKGDLYHQESKFQMSGLAGFVRDVEVVAEKDPGTYRKVLTRHRVEPERFLMVGNSVKSDVLPVLAIGGHAVHVPYHVLWEHEHVEAAHPVGDEPYATLGSLAELPSWLLDLDSAPPL